MSSESHALLSLSEDELAQVATYAFWLRLGFDTEGRALLQVLEEEFIRRGAGARLRLESEAVLGAVWQTVSAIERARPLESQPKMRKLLRLIVEGTLTTGEPVKQETLGRAYYEKDVFERSALAAEVARLRGLLPAYYATDGIADPLRILLPTGKYVALFRNLSLRRPPWLGDRPEAPGAGLVRPLNALPGLSVFPAFSPDSERVVFSWNRGDGMRFGLFYQSSDDAAPTELTSTRLTGDVCPAWSPDGQHVAFLRYSPLAGSVMALEIGPDGKPGPERRLARISRFRSEMVGRHLAWFPDGRALAVSTAQERGAPFAICRVALEGGPAEPITAPPEGSLGDGDPAISPDGRALAFVRTEAVGVKDVFVTDLATARVVRLTSDRKHVHGITWRADGQSLIVASSRAGVPGLWQVPLSGEPPVTLAVPCDRPHYPTCSPSGERLAFTNLVVNSSIWETRLRGGVAFTRQSRRLIFSARSDVNPHVSPDGRWIAFASDRTGTFENWVCERDGSNPVKVSALPRGSSAGTPRWSPDGTHIAFDARRAGQTHIHVLDVETRETRLVVGGDGDHVTPSWSRDGRWLYFTSIVDGARQVRRVPSAGGEAIAFTRREGLNPVESPDGRWLYFARPSEGLLRVPTAGGREELVCGALKASCWGLWDVTSDAVFYVNSPQEGEGDCSIERLDLRTRQTKRVTTLKGMTAVHYQGLSVCPDGTALVFSRLDRAAGEIIVADSLT